jgi:hypothetical protein
MPPAYSRIENGGATWEAMIEDYGLQPAPRRWCVMGKKPFDVASAPARPAPSPVHCHTCHQVIAVADGVSYGSIETGYRELCSRCFNEEVARRGELDFQHVQFEPQDMADAGGGVHRFHFRLHLLGDRVALNAFELDEQGDPGGYEFQVLGDPEEDLFALMGQLIERMRRTLTQRHLQYEKGFGWGIADFLARGRITWNEEEDGRVPLLVIDGHPITWEQFGRMLMSFEGWQFKLEIRDKSEVI